MIQTIYDTLNRRMNIALILNSDAGSLLGTDAADVAGKVCAAFQKEGHSCSLHLGPKNTLAEALQNISGDVEAIVVGGGDGTVVAAANLALEKGVALGILPLGTVNQLARDLNIPLDFLTAVEALAQGSVKGIDVGMVNDQLFLNTAVLGVFVDLSRKREATRNDTGPLKWPYLLAEMGRDVINAEPMLLTLDIGRKKRKISTCAVLVSNNDFEDAPNLIPKKSSMDRGEIALLIAESQSGWGFLNLMARLFLGKTSNTPKLTKMILKEFRISSLKGTLTVSIDGEKREMVSPLHFYVRPSALKVIVPADADQKIYLATN